MEEYEMLERIAALFRDVLPSNLEVDWDNGELTIYDRDTQRHYVYKPTEGEWYEIEQQLVEDVRIGKAKIFYAAPDLDLSGIEGL